MPLTARLGLPRRAISSDSSRTTRRPEIEVSGTAAKPPSHNPSMPDNLSIARQHLRAELRADHTHPDDPDARVELERWPEMVDITERLERLMVVPHEE